MAADTVYLKRRRQSWYFQIAVPRNVQRALGQLRGTDNPIEVLVEPLQTRDKVVAQRLRWDKHRETLDLFDRLRGKKTLTLAEIEEAADPQARFAPNARSACNTVDVDTCRASRSTRTAPSDRGRDQEALGGRSGEPRAVGEDEGAVPGDTAGRDGGRAHVM